MSKHKKNDLSQNMSVLFDAKTVTRDELIGQMKYWFPRGSGPLGMMKFILGLLSQIAELRGFQPITYEEVFELSQESAAVPNEL